MVLLAADHPPRCLHDFLNARVQVGVVVAGAEDHAHALLHLFVDRVQLRQPQGRDERADQARTGQVDAFAKRAAQHRKTDALAVFGELFEKRPALGFGHAARLLPQCDVRVSLGE